jgi:hypothetical protein
MKVRKDTVGMMAEVVWRDPFRVTINPSRSDLSDMTLDESIFPLQKERGTIVAVREGIVVVCHTTTTDSPLCEGVEMDCTFVPEDRIESVAIALEMVPMEEWVKRRRESNDELRKESSTSGASRLDAAIPS